MSSDYSNIQPQPQTRKGLAIASLVLGILSILTLGLLVVGAIAAIVLGVIALGRIKKEPATYGGKGMAIAGIITSGVSLLLIAVFGIMATIAVPRIMQYIRHEREAITIKSLRTIHNNQAMFITTHSRFATLNELVEAGLLNQSYASGGAISGYVYSSSDVSKETYCVQAVRTSAAVANRDFIVCEDGIIRYVESKTPGLVKRGEGTEQ
jgi:type II secretory pathway pseudopilin PulG